MVQKIEHNDLAWRGNSPVSTAFDDVYYSADNGLEETKHVFLHGIGAPDVWMGRDHYVIAETGFGTGLNFLATWRAFKESGAKGRLTFISAEGFPLTEDALRSAHETFPEIATYSQQLCAAWPPASDGFHPRIFEDGRITLLLLFGDAPNALSRLNAKVDAWFLDGFAPAKNPAMWSAEILDQVARLAKPGTKLATFTAAGFVRRGLSERGFEIVKAPGYGRKRERLIGEAQAPLPLTQCTHSTVPEWATLPPQSEGPFVVVGAGVAGRSVAYALARRGKAVTLLHDPASPSASTVPAAILAPRFILGEQSHADFFTSAYAFALVHPSFAGHWADVASVDLLTKSDAARERYSKLVAHLNWSTDWLTWDGETLHLPRGGAIATQSALNALTADIDMRAFRIDALEQVGSIWRLTDHTTGESIEAAHVVLATGVSTVGVDQSLSKPEIRPNKGQVELLRDDELGHAPPVSLNYGGYLTAATAGIRTLGSTFEKIVEVRERDYAPNDTSRIAIEEQFSAATGLRIPATAHRASWAGVRATTADHMPYVGALYNTNQILRQYAALAKDAKTVKLGPSEPLSGISVLTGLGAKGFQYGPILGEFLAASLCGDPLPLPEDHIAALHPLRQVIKAIKRSN
ncbi:tRNA (5-methylaminomethyl-2-thiouridine)(34)-methyltransferase MnmD [Kordiimonas sp.]|uniref:tRNA (5-methylaminomethyl-2-thiouridine)(34)-methyltransferase MnmD n=1 Tax=Kordiimonas sp. TaxID=1970157 RepID=UPI003B51A64F